MQFVNGGQRVESPLLSDDGFLVFAGQTTAKDGFGVGEHVGFQGGQVAKNVAGKVVMKQGYFWTFDLYHFRLSYFSSKQQAYML